MPKQVQQGSLFGKHKSKLATSVAKHKDDPIDTGGGSRLPAGIEDGIAELKDIRIGKYKDGQLKGEPFFIASGVVLMPTEFEGRKIEGLQTQITEPLCDTPQSKGKKKTFDDHWQFVQNVIKMLGGQDCLDGINTEDGDQAEADLNELLNTLKTMDPPICFNFRTWKGSATPQFPNPRTQETWGTACERPAGDGDPAESDVDDQSADEQPEDEQSAADEAPDYAALGEAADGGDEEAAKQLLELAKAAGFTKKQAEDDYENWTSLAEAIAEKTAGEPGEGEGEPEPEPEEEEPKIPAKGEVYNYQAIDPKTKKPAVNKMKKPVLVSVEVTAVDKAKETVTLKNLDDGKTVYKAVPFDQLKDA